MRDMLAMTSRHQHVLLLPVAPHRGKASTQFLMEQDGAYTYRYNYQGRGAGASFVSSHNFIVSVAAWVATGWLMHGSRTGRT
jgi:hypothetical protein